MGTNKRYKHELMDKLQRQSPFSRLPKQNNQWITIASDPAAPQTFPPKVRKFKWSTSLDQSNDKIDLTTAHALDGDLSTSIDWSAIQLSAIQRSSAGSQGVYFAQLATAGPDRPLIVLKPPVHSLSSELLSTLISQQLQVYTPQCYLLSMESQAGIQLMHSIKAVDPSGQATIALFDQRNLIVKPFCLGLCADKIPLNISRHRLFQSYLVERSAGDNHVRLSSGGCEIFRSIGRLMAVDTLLNNGDRLPLLWDNPGNAGNLYIIQTATDNRTKFLVINLDPQCRPIDPSKRFDEFNDYVRRVKLLLGADVSGEHARYRDRQFDTVLTLICQWVGGLDLSADQLIFARKEMIAGYRQVLVDDLQGDRDQLIERLRLCIDVVSEAITRGAVDSVTISGGHDAAATGGGNYEKQELADLRCAWRWLEAICRALPG